VSSLEGRTAVVTGAGQGVGRGIAHALAAAGAAVVVAARRTETGEPVAAEIRSRGGTAVCIQSDVTVRADVQRAVDAAVATYGGLDVMVHNAFRGGRPHRLEDADDAMWSSYSRTAVWAAYYCAQTAYPRLRDSGSGRFVLVVSPPSRAVPRCRCIHP
jgi:3-oxoacyl-[acyl-carrier protein] reductase